MSVPFIQSDDSVTVLLDGQTIPVSADVPQYGMVVKALQSGDEQALRNALLIRETIAASVDNCRVTLENKVLMFDGRPLHHSLCDRIVSVIADGFTAEPLLRFLDNLMDNPSKRAVDQLYGFLEACDLPITPDGYFVAYKRVRGDYTDCHTGTFDNSVGSVASMPRNQVDEDPERTCSSGLHVCSQSYLPDFGSSARGDRVVLCKINPRDVVAVPVDYNNAKMRVCEYEVVGEIDIDETTVTSNFTTEFSDDDFDETNTFECVDCGDDLEDWQADVCDDCEDSACSAVASEIAEKIEDWQESWDDTEGPTAQEIDCPQERPHSFSSGVYDPTCLTEVFTSIRPKIGKQEIDDDDVEVRSTDGPNYTQKLNEQKVRDIRNMLEDGFTLAAISKAHGVSSRQVARIRDGESWGHVT